VLFRWLQQHPHSLVFPTTTGSLLRYDNVKRDFMVILRACGVEKTKGSFHAFRRYLGKQYLRNGGNPLYLQRVFGHSTLAMVNRYVEADNEDLQTAHKALSPLESLKRRS
jgi:integrase